MALVACRCRRRGIVSATTTARNQGYLRRGALVSPGLSESIEDLSPPPTRWFDGIRRSPTTALITAVCIVAFGATLAVVLGRSDAPLPDLGRSLWRIDDD